MKQRWQLTGEDTVIVLCVAMLTLLTIVALVALTVRPEQANTIIPVMAGTVIAISSLAARHPPVLKADQATVTIDDKPKAK